MHYFLSILILFSAINLNAQTQKNLLTERGDFKTSLKKLPPETEKLEEPKSSLFSLVKYPTSLGNMKAYLSNVSDKKKKHPAIIWITGGFPVGGAGSYVWEDADNENDQSAQVYRQKGIVMMYPSFRGYAGNPGKVEGFFGEVNDVLSALEYLRKLDFVDPKQIYLGGHSTGGTLALLTACATDKFKAVFSFGPTADPAGYGSEYEKHDNSKLLERKLRAPKNFLKYIKVPTYVLEGESGNSDSINEMKEICKNKNVRFSVIRGADHFNVLWPINKLFAKRIIKGNIEVTDQEMQKAFRDMVRNNREADDFSTLSYLKRSGISFTDKVTANYYAVSREKELLQLLQNGFKLNKKVKNTALKTYKDRNGQPYYVLVVDQEVVLNDLKNIFLNSATVELACRQIGVSYDGWSVN